MLPLNDHNGWYYPAPGNRSDDEELTSCRGRGNWGKKSMKGARWVRARKMVAWGSNMDDWEAEEHARRRLRELLPRPRSRSPPGLSHLRSPSPPMAAPYPPPNALHLSYSSFVLDKAVTRSFRSGLLDELEEVTNGLIEGEATLRRAMGRLWQVIAEEGEVVSNLKQKGEKTVVTKVEDEDGEREEQDVRERRVSRAPDLMPTIRKLFLATPVDGGTYEGDGQLEGLEKAIGGLKELEDDGREYVERLEEIREGLGEIRDERNGVWAMVRQEGIEEMQEDARYQFDGTADRRGA